MRLRLLSALVLAPLALAAIWLGGIAWMVLLVLGFTGLAVEWTQLCGRRAGSPAGLLLLLSLTVAAAMAWAGQVPSAVLVLGVGGGIVAVAARQDGAATIAWGVPYLGLALLALIWLRQDDGRLNDGMGRANLIFVVLVVWATDIGAYVAGRLFGGRKLAPRISPGKTWSGAAGGLVAATVLPVLLIGVATGAWPAEAAATASLLSVLAQAGDLFESGLKRRFGVKDSGRLIPGHGGLLDRLDGLLAAAPAAAVLAALLGRQALL